MPRALCCSPALRGAAALCAAADPHCTHPHPTGAANQEGPPNVAMPTKPCTALEPCGARVTCCVCSLCECVCESAVSSRDSSCEA